MLKLFERKQKGFTLIELLVVISIIGILSSIVLISMGGAREKARDAKRQSDIRQIATACELFYSDDEGYPVRADFAALKAADIGDYMASATILEDPTNSGTLVYTWETTTATTDQEFCVWAELESGSSTKYVAASERGVQTDLAAAPTGLGTSCY